VKDASARIAQIEAMLEKKQIYIADFYFKTKDYDAAKARYEEILKSIKDTNEVSRITARIQEADKLIKH
jgi:outer membrane protein assembly factor BamD